MPERQLFEFRALLMARLVLLVCVMTAIFFCRLIGALGLDAGAL